MEISCHVVLRPLASGARLGGVWSSGRAGPDTVW